MRRILFQETDFASLPNPPAGFKYIGFDGPNFSEKDENGISTTPGGGVVNVTYSELVDKISNSELLPGTYYKITDFRTCYEQPNYDIYGGSITSDNYKVGNNYPIITFATDVNKLDSYAFQPDFPKDIIRYDISYNVTEISGGTAYGRIVERVDEWNNRTDYDHREVLFKRYDWFDYNYTNIQSGTISVSGGVVTGVDTVFTNLSENQVIAIPNFSEKFFRIASIDSDTEMTLTGIVSDVSISEVKYYTTSTMNGASYKKNNANSDTVSYEYTTFGDAIDNEAAFNNYIGDHGNAYNEWSIGEFYLANNVFLGGEYYNNKFGNNCYNNTFDDDCTDNEIGNFFYNNITNDDFDGNQIYNHFYNNVITANFQRNVVGENFYENIITNGSFYRNKIGEGFYSNTVFGGDFQNNIIGNNFHDNFIRTTGDGFLKNNIGVGFLNNYIWAEFDSNIFGNGSNNNNFWGDFYENKIGDYYEYNTIYSQFYKNVIKNSFNNNTVGNLNNINNISFYKNDLGNDFKGNLLPDDFSYNIIDSNFASNEFSGAVSANKIGSGFTINLVGNDFFYNTIGNGFFNNTISYNFQYNNIGHFFRDNLVANDFGFGGGQARGNKVGNYFENNTIGEYFYDNIIPDVFTQNTIGNYFQLNNIKVQNLYNINFLEYLGGVANIMGLSGSTPSGTDGTYSVTQTSTNGDGSGAEFLVEVASGLVSNVSVLQPGNGYNEFDSITISYDQFGDGGEDLTVLVSNITNTPAVYTSTNCEIIRDIDGDVKLIAWSATGAGYLETPGYVSIGVNEAFA